VDWKVFAVGLFVIGACYLIASIPGVNAVQITISSPGGGSSQTISYTPSAYVNKDVSVDGSGNVRVRVSNASATTGIENVYIFRCQDRTPSTCLSEVSPQQMNGNTDVTYSWGEVSDTSGQTANIMLLVRETTPNGGRWLAFWTRGSSTPNYQMLDSDISDITINAKSVSNVSVIRNFISINGMLPFNTAWMSSIVLQGVAGFHKADSAAPPATSGQTYVSSGSIGGIAGDYAFLFPDSGSGLLNGIAVAKSQGFVCGNSNCESVYGESSVNCCLDCGVTANYYCDTSLGQKQLADISLSSATPGEVKLMNCNQENTINMDFRINNMPTGTMIETAQYRLNGSSTSRPTTCTRTGSNIFTCPVVTPAVSGCSGSDYRLEPNYMTITIRFNNATSTMTKAFSPMQFPLITVGSWTCGSFGCEPSLGENQANCCYDCGCPASQACDYTGQPATATCKALPASQDLSIVSISPLHFYTHDATNGNNLGVVMQLANAPASTSGTTAGCTVTQCLNGTLATGMPCAGAACSMTCSSSTPSSNPSIYNSSCTVNFRITGYDPTNNYTLYTRLTRGVTFANGTYPAIAASLDVLPPTISVGSHWAGDGVCNPDETYTSVCYDCSCPLGQYCNTTSRLGPSAGDGCKPLTDMNITVDGIGGTAFPDANYAYNITVRAHTAAKPQGYSVSGRCGFNGSVGGPMCQMTCNYSADLSRYNIECNITVPQMIYTLSPFYDSATRKITLPSNFFALDSQFNNGSRITVASQSFSFPHVEVGVRSHLWDGICSTDLGETNATACLDGGACGCSARYVCRNDSAHPGGMCRPDSEIILVFDSTDPSPPKCTIEMMDGTCMFTEALKLNTHIVNMPAGARIIDSWFSLGENTSNMVCVSGSAAAHYSCSVVPDNIATVDVSSVDWEGMTSDEIEDYVASWGSTKTVNYVLGMTISYTENGTRRTQNLSAAASISITTEVSDYIKNCIEKIQEYTEEIEEYEQEETIIYAVMGTILGVATTCFILDHLPWTKNCCTACWKWGFCIGSCVGSVLIPMLIDAMDEIESLKEQREAQCASDSYDEISSSTSDSFSIGSTLIGLVLGIVCTICALKAFGGTPGSGSTGSTTVTSTELQTQMDTATGVGYTFSPR
jgi:hypothetical protein